MSIFSKKKEKTLEITNSVTEWNKSEENKIPKILPDTLMQRISIAQNSNEGLITPKRIFTDDIKATLKMKSQVKDEYKKIPEDIHKESNSKGPEQHEMEKVIMIKEPMHKESEAEPLIAAPQVKIEQVAQIAKMPEKIHEMPQSVHHHSFFAELERIFGHKHDVKHILSQDMMAKMKEYHDAIGKGDAFFMHEMDIELEIEKSLTSLKDIETEWLLTKKGVASAERLLFAKEEELEKRLSDFKNLLVTADRFKNFNMVSPEGSAFLLSNGVRLFSIQQLLNELPEMSDEIFYAHVTLAKNDFASWIRDVFKQDALALKLMAARTKQEILDILRKY
jgi:hypothetical protein